MNKIISLLLFGIFLFLGKTSAQCPSDINFDWENSNFSNWIAYFPNNPNGLSIGSPFTNPNGGLAIIENIKDYYKQDGWVLLKKEFGCNSLITRYPYFILTTNTDH